MTFRQLVKHLENRLGYHQMPVDAGAEGPQDLFESCPLHDDLTKQLVRGIYKRNRCQHMGDPVYQDKTESVLKEIRNCVRQEKRTDVDRYNFVEDYCQAVHEFFTDDRLLDNDTRTDPSDTRSSAQIIDFERYRMRKLRWRA